jgi:molybdopterin-binding protein/molybdate transport repressor ModE-like protein
VTGTRTLYPTPDDVRLLEAVAREGSLAAAARAIGIHRDRGVYRMERLGRIAGGPVLAADKGGAARGSSRLTRRGWALLHRSATAGPAAADAAGRPSPVGPTILSGRFTRRPYPAVRLPGGISLAVGFRAADGQSVRVAVDPESVLLARRAFATSARNVLHGRVGRRRVVPGGLVRIDLHVGPVRLASLVTRRAVRSLRLAPGSPVVLFIKATALRPV